MTSPAADSGGACSPRLPWLIIGYGNELRGDDAVGPHVARSIETKHLPGVRVLITPLLAPEIADDLAQAENVIFIDAGIDVTEVKVEKLSPIASANIIAHANSPATMLALAQDVFGHAPSGWLITIPAPRMDFHDELSSVATTHAALALEKALAAVTPHTENDVSRH